MRYGEESIRRRATDDVKAKRYNGVTAQRLLCGSAGFAVLQVNIEQGPA